MATAVNERTFSRILPESTGDRIGFLHTWDIEYKDKTGTFTVGDTVIDSLSGLQGIILKDTIDNNLNTSGVVSVKLLPNFESAISTVNSALMVNTVTKATTVVGYSMYIGRGSVVGFNNPSFGQFVDAHGQAYVRFQEGSPQFDGFGKLKISTETTLGEYDFHYDSEDEHFHDFITGSASLTFEAASSGLLLSCGTVSGDNITRMSNTYYTYQVGRSQLIEIAATLGDSGKPNVNRIWGYGDDANGVFFLLEGSTLNAYIRNSSSGSVIETKIPQSAWTEDRLDGSGNAKNVSGATLDLQDVNIFWLDFQLNGTIRFGVSINGDRIVCHIQHNTNVDALPFMRIGKLPLLLGQENTGTAGSTSEFRVWSVVVKTEGVYEPKEHHYSGSVSNSTCTTADTCVMSVRSKQTYKTLDNRVIAHATKVSIFSTTEPVLVQLVKNATLTGTPTWANSVSDDSSVEYDTGATLATGGTVLACVIVPVGLPAKLDLTEVFSFDGEAIERRALITLFDTYSFRVTRLSGTTTDVTLALDWHEID